MVLISSGLGRTVVQCPQNNDHVYESAPSPRAMPIGPHSAMTMCALGLPLQCNVGPPYIPINFVGGIAAPGASLQRRMARFMYLTPIFHMHLAARLMHVSALGNLCQCESRWSQGRLHATVSGARFASIGKRAHASFEYSRMVVEISRCVSAPGTTFPADVSAQGYNDSSRISCI